jgi:hypothetical protein
MEVPVLASLALAVLAAAPEPAPSIDDWWTRVPPEVHVGTGSADGALTFDAVLRAQVAVLSGAIDGTSSASSPGLTILPEGLRYEELFDPGFGVTLETGLMVEVDRPRGAGGDPVCVGGYLSAQQAWFNASPVSDDLGQWISPYPMTVTTLMAGVRGALPVLPALFLDLRAGGGAVHFSAVDADVAAPYPVEVALFKAGWKAAGEARAHLRYQLGAVSFLLGAGARLSPGPEAAGPVNGGEIDPQSLWQLDGELGIEVGF